MVEGKFGKTSKKFQNIMKMIVVYVASDSHRNVRHIVVLIRLAMLRNTRLKDISRLLLMQPE